MLSCLAWLVVLECSVVGEFLGGGKRVRLNRKTPAHLAGYGRDGGFQSRPKAWQRLRVEDPRFRHIGAKAIRGCIRLMKHHGLRDRVGVG